MSEGLYVDVDEHRVLGHKVDGAHVGRVFPPSAVTDHRISEGLYADVNEHQVSGHEVDGAHALKFDYNWDMEDDQQGINGDNGEYQRGGCNDEDSGEDRQAIHYVDKDQQVIHNDNEDGDEGQCSQPNHHRA